MTDRDRAPGARRSTRTVALVFAAVAGWQWYWGREFAATAAAAAAVALFAGSFSSIVAGWFHERWMALAVFLGHVNQRILLTAVYVAVVTPTGLILRLMGRDLLDRRGRRRSSYWVARPIARQTRASYERPF